MCRRAAGDDGSGRQPERSSAHEQQMIDGESGVCINIAKETPPPWPIQLPSTEQVRSDRRASKEHHAAEFWRIRRDRRHTKSLAVRCRAVKFDLPCLWTDRVHVETVELSVDGRRDRGCD